MKQIKRLKMIGWLFLISHLIMAPVDFFLINDRYAYPFFNWELGFGKIYSSITQPIVIIHSLNEQTYSDGEDIHSLSQRLKWKNRWRKTNDVKFLLSLIRYLKDNNHKEFNARRKIFENKFFRMNGYHEVIYKIDEKTIDIRTGESRIKEYGPYRFVDNGNI